jgi:hypothetical protein
MNIIVNADTPQFVSWLAGVEKISVDHATTHYPNLPKPTFEASFGTRYVRVFRSSSSSHSVHAFVDRTNGDVLKPATFRAPAKHARGNLFDSQNGLGSMGEYGPAYLR